MADSSFLPILMKAAGLETVCENVRLLSSGNDFIPLVTIDCSATKAELPRTLRYVAQAYNCIFVTISAAREALPSSLPEEDLAEKLVSLAVSRNGQVRHLVQKLKTRRRTSALENEQALLVHRKELLQHYELILDLLLALSNTKPIVVAVEDTSGMERTFREFLLYFGRSVHVRQENLQRGETWPRVVFFSPRRRSRPPAGAFHSHGQIPAPGEASDSRVPEETVPRFADFRLSCRGALSAYGW